MQLSPTVRWLLVGLATAATAAATVLPDGFQAIDVLPILLAFLTGVGITPPTARSEISGDKVDQDGVFAPKLRRQDGAGTINVVLAILLVLLIVIIVPVGGGSLFWLLLIVLVIALLFF